MADLNTAKQEALTRSTDSKKTFFVSVDAEGSHTVSDKQTKESLFAFEGGKEVPMLPIVEEKVKKASTKTAKPKSISKTKPKKKMATKAKPAAKKEKAKKTPAKKAEKKNSGLIGKGTTVSLTKTQWDKFHKMGNIRQLVTDAVVKTYKL
jgi:hypothetical protein